MNPRQTTLALMDTKRCSRCKLEKNISEFPKSQSGRDGINSFCKMCRNDWSRKYRKENSDFRKKHYSATRRWALKKRYGITPEDYEKLLRSQGGVCAICKDNKKEDLFVDHDHSTGKVRGLLCRHCNTGIGHFFENPTLMRLAIDYVERQNALL